MSKYVEVTDTNDRRQYVRVGDIARLIDTSKSTSKSNTQIRRSGEAIYAVEQYDEIKSRIDASESPDYESIVRSMRDRLTPDEIKKLFAVCIQMLPR